MSGSSLVPAFHALVAISRRALLSAIAIDVAALAAAEKLGSGSRAVNLTATGDFDAATSDVTAHRVLLELRPAS